LPAPSEKNAVTVDVSLTPAAPILTVMARAFWTALVTRVALNAAPV
jgi:hypothetical protein